MVSLEVGESIYATIEKLRVERVWWYQNNQWNHPGVRDKAQLHEYTERPRISPSGVVQ